MFKHLLDQLNGDEGTVKRHQSTPSIEYSSPMNEHERANDLMTVGSCRGRAFNFISFKF